MSEFNNRIDVQRQILTIINSKNWTEELNGLSKGAIDRWINSNMLNSTSDLVCTINEAAKKLFFLANKSQEQITKEYQLLSTEVEELKNRILIIMSKHGVAD